MTKKLLFILVFLFLLSTITYFVLKYFTSVSQVSSGVNAKKFGSECEFAGQCGDIVGINCGAEVDGPFYYVDKNTEEILEYCGGYCMTDDPSGVYCQNCPPKDWNCNQ